MKLLSSRTAKILMLLPSMLVYLVFIILPIGIAVYYSFTDYSGIGKAEWTGMQNYERLFSDKLFTISMRNTFTMLLCCMVFLFIVSFLIGLMINKDFRGNALVKAVIFTPYIIAPIIIGILWSYILNPNYGLLNSFLRAIGLDSFALEWIGGKKLSPLSFAIVFTWQMLGFHATIFLAGLKTIPQELYEAAVIDGATKVQQVFKITIPMLKETIIINMVLIITGVFKIFELVVQLTGGGPAHMSEILTSYMYYTVFTSRRYGYGMAIATVVLIISVASSFLYIRITSRKQNKNGGTA